ncbi:hypothetical protein HBH70_152610 [Parastagonospora nodorum]|nr:hypothetical protein HBH53_166110 [Parastagonospora nodorum]KAH3965452.1 hypothetical protein HBH51_151920 [Parastagonospora nodorum]KAH3977468.1 hypothetical protein HBH52_112250 [Parastagonospora nodorum]KAH4000145.1 hypothetical protein HBI10_109500 [Parastagonospora nodorum]KAH4022218.1 hypothetical protein HBI13_099680 [Parastagonospora nodorum]
MAPVEPEAAARNNIFAYAPFGGQIALVVGLTAHVLLVARRAAKSLPPTSSTRSQQPLRRRYAIIFSTLAALSLASVTTFAVIWRAMSYVDWLQTGTSNTKDGRWYLGDWVYDVDLHAQSDAVAVSKPEGFLYTCQHFVGLLASSIFFGIEGHRRNLHASTIAAFVILGATGSLGYALSLFFVTILYTPLTLHQDDSPLHDALFTPSPVVYYLPITASMLFLYNLPTAFNEHAFLARNFSVNKISFLRWGKIAVPLLVAFAPQLVPVSLGRQHVSKTAAHRSYARVFQYLSAMSFMLYWILLFADITKHTPAEPHSTVDRLKKLVGLSVNSSLNSRILSGISEAAQLLKKISKDPIISATSTDVLFTVISLLTWTFTRDQDVESILENSMLAFLVPKHEKHVAFEEDAKLATDLQPEPEVLLDTTTPRKRGRPSKNKSILTSPAASSTGSIRRSSRRSARNTDIDSDVDSTYQPSSTTKREVAETETDGTHSEQDLVQSAESTALALFLTFAGGLGQLAAGALGAEVTGPRE